MEPLLLITTDDVLEKGKGNRDGLIQQIVTYVRDGHTITRKQWVRSEFADHAKKNEEEKKETMLKEEERKENKRRNDIADEAKKKATEDKRARKRKAKEKEEMSGGGRAGRNRKVNSDKLDAYKKKLDKKRKKEDEDRKKEDKKKKDEQKSKKKKGHGAYGQQDQTKADNKAEQNMMTRPS